MIRPAVINVFALVVLKPTDVYFTIIPFPKFAICGTLGKEAAIPKKTVLYKFSGTENETGAKFYIIKRR